MGYLDKVQGISRAPHNRFTVFMGKPGSGKTTSVGTFPKPMLYVAIDTDGGGEVLKSYRDDEIETIQITSDIPGTPGAKHLQTKLMELLEELKRPHKYKTVVFDAYSSVEESLVNYMEKIKGKKLNLEERGSIGTLMLNLRNKIIDLSNGDVEYVAICHVKDKDYTDNTSGEVSKMIIPKMSANNGNILMERASAVIYNTRRTVVEEDGTRVVKFLAYIGPHPNMDTKIRTDGVKMEKGIYVENFTYSMLQNLIKGNKIEQKELNVIESPENPFQDEEKGENE